MPFFFFLLALTSCCCQIKVGLTPLWWFYKTRSSLKATNQGSIWNNFKCHPNICQIFFRISEKTKERARERKRWDHVISHIILCGRCNQYEGFGNICQELKMRCVHIMMRNHEVVMECQKKYDKDIWSGLEKEKVEKLSSHKAWMNNGKLKECWNQEGWEWRSVYQSQLFLCLFFIWAMVINHIVIYTCTNTSRATLVIVPSLLAENLLRVSLSY